MKAFQASLSLYFLYNHNAFPKIQKKSQVSKQVDLN
jgi:hypothetical protein